jgi:MFS family permease
MSPRRTPAASPPSSGLLFGLAGMGSAAVAVTLPAIAADLDLSTGGVSWVISLYALMLAVATAVYGRVADLAGIRLPLLVGVALMAGSAVLGALAPSYEVLLVARLLQGSGAAAVPVLGMAIVSARYDGSVRATALGRVAGTAAAVSALGPLAGGVVEELLSWRAVVALPALGLLVVPALWRAVPTQGTGARLDLFGACSSPRRPRACAARAVAVLRGCASPSWRLLLLPRRPAATAWVRRRPEGFLPMARRPGAVVVAARSPPRVCRRLVRAAHRGARRSALRGWTPPAVGLALVPSAVTGFSPPAWPAAARAAGPSRRFVTSGGTAAWRSSSPRAVPPLRSAVLLVAPSCW